MNRAARIATLLAVAALLALGLALAVGSTGFAPALLVDVVSGTADPLAADILVRLRLPRALAAFATGGLLALAGALMQVLLRNPLADPYVLGLSGGAAAGALLAMLAGLGALGIDACAALGAALSVVIVLVLARRGFAARHPDVTAEAPVHLLLTGVALAAGWGALVSLLLALAPEAGVRGMLFWLMGDLNGVEAWWPPLAGLAIAGVAVWPAARSLNVMLQGEAIARSLGVRTGALRLLIYVIASAATALAVTTAGTVGFVGLIVPHALRLAVGNDQRILLPCAALAGGTLLLVADTLARTVVAPMQLPVGVLTALIGVPVFIALVGGRR